MAFGDYGFCLYGSGLYGYGGTCITGGFTYTPTESPYVKKAIPFKKNVDNYIGFVYKTTQRTYPYVQLLSGSTILWNAALPESNDWTYDYIQVTGVTWTGADLRLSLSGNNSSGSSLSLNYHNITYSGPYNPLNPHGPTVRLMSLETNSAHTLYTGREVAFVSSEEIDWNTQRKTFPGDVRENFYGLSFTNTWTSGAYAATEVPNMDNYSGRNLVFSAYARNLGTSKCANNGLQIFGHDGVNTYISRFYIPSGVGNERQFRQSISFPFPTTGTNLVIGLTYSGNTHGPTENLYVDGYQLEILDRGDAYPVKGRPSPYHASGNFVRGYKFEAELMEGLGTGCVANPTILEGFPGYINVDSVDTYAQNGSLVISHDSYKQVSVFRNFGPEGILQSGTVRMPIHIPITARGSATYGISIKYSTDSFRISGAGAGLSLGLQGWTNQGEPPENVLIASGIAASDNHGVSDWKNVVYYYTHNPRYQYITPYILASGFVGTIKIDDVRLLDKELDNRTRKYNYDPTRPTLDVKLSENYNVIENVYKENIGSTTWRTVEDDTFLLNTLDIKSAPQWNFIYRQHLYQWVGAVYTPPGAGPLRVVGTISNPGPYNDIMYSIENGNMNHYDAAFVSAQGAKAIYVGYTDSAEGITSMTYTNSITVDETYAFLLHQVNNILKTITGTTWNREFYASPNRFYLTKKGQNSEGAIRLNDGITRDIRHNDGNFFPPALYPHRARCFPTITGQTDLVYGIPSGNFDIPRKAWASQITDIATHALSAYVFYCGTIYHWNWSDASGSQVYQTANFIGAMPKSYPDSVGIRNIGVTNGYAPGPVEKQYGAIIYASGNTPVTGALGATYDTAHFRNLNIPRFVGLACTGEYFDGSDMPSLVVAESTGPGDTGNINLKVLFHSAYEDMNKLDYGTFWYTTSGNIACTGAPEFYYDSTKAIIYDVMQIQNVRLPNKIYNGNVVYPSGLTMVPFKLSYNDRSKMLYAHTKDWYQEFATSYVFKDFPQWSYERLRYYSNFTAIPSGYHINYKTLNINTPDSEHFETYAFTSLTGSISGNSKIPLISYYDPQNAYISIAATASVSGDNGDESFNTSIEAFYRCKYQLDGNNLVSLYANGSRGSRNQTEYVEQAVYHEPIIAAINNYGDEIILSGNALTSGVYNNIKITQDYTINYLTGEVWLNKIPATVNYNMEAIRGSYKPNSSIYTLQSGFNTSGTYDRELVASYSNRYTIPYCASKDETILSFLGKIAEADHAIAAINQENELKYEPKDYAVNTQLNPSYQAFNHRNLPIKNLGLLTEENLSNVQNAIFDDSYEDRQSAKPTSWSNYSVGSGYISVTEDIAKFSRKAASIISTGRNYCGFITSNPIYVAANKEYTTSMFYMTQGCNSQAKYNILPEAILSSGTASGWLLTITGNGRSEINSRGNHKNKFTYDVLATGGFSLLTQYAIPIDLYDNYTLTVDCSGANTLNVELLFTYSGGGLAYSSYNSLALSSSHQSVTVTGCPRTIFEQSTEIVPRYVIPRLSSTGSTSRFSISDIRISGDRKHGPVFGVLEYNTNGTLVNKTFFNLRDNTNGFNRFRNTFTTTSTTAFINLQMGMKNTDGVAVFDGARVDLGDRTENFIVNNSLLEVSDFPLGQTTYTKNYKQDVDYVYNIDRSIISMVDKNLLPNGWFQNYDYATPNGFITHITGTTVNNYPTLYKNTTQGLYNYHSLGISLSGNGKVEIVSPIIPIDGDREYRVAINAIASGKLDVGTEETSAVIPLLVVEYYDKDMKLINKKTNAVVT